MLKVRNHKLTRELLDNYQSAALVNAQQLADEASLLLEEEHYAQAYFLYLASIEEIGKAQISFDA